MAGFCNNCHQPIEGNKFKMKNGKKICLNCLNLEATQKQNLIQNDRDKEGMFSFLISSFNITHIPESWYNQIDGMLKKGFNCQGIEFTIKYCKQKGKTISEENWSALVYIYYQEAQFEWKRQQQIQSRNEQKEIKSTIETVKVCSTTYRDQSIFKIEDL